MNKSEDLLRAIQEAREKKAQAEALRYQKNLKENIILQKGTYSWGEVTSQDPHFNPYVALQPGRYEGDPEQVVAKQLLFARFNCNDDLFWVMKYYINEKLDYYNLNHISAPEGWGRNLWPTEGNLVTLGWKGPNFFAYDFVRLHNDK